MKRITIIIAFALLAISCGRENGKAILIGNIDCYNGGIFMLVTETPGKGNSFDTLAVDQQGNFRQEVELVPGCGYLLWPEFLGNNSYEGTYHVVLTPGKKSTIKIKGTPAADGHIITTAEFGGAGAAEAEYLVEDAKFSSRDSLHSAYGATLTFKEYCEAIESRLAKMDKLLEQCDDDTFVAAQKEKMKNTAQIYPFNYAWVQRFAGNRMDADEDFVKYVSSLDANALDQTSQGLTLERIHWMAECEGDPSYTTQYNMMKALDKIVTDQNAKNELAFQTMSIVCALGGCNDIDQMYTFYKSIVTDKDRAESLSEMVKAKAEAAKFKHSIPCVLEDVDGNKYDFQALTTCGKYVYIDLWATWCGGCLAEMPAFGKLVERYKDNPRIDFISISMDYEKDHDKWVKKVKADGHSWKNFIVPGDFNSAIAKEYDINGLPRFLVFDPQCILINIRANKPSDPETVKYIDRLLQ